MLDTKLAVRTATLTFYNIPDGMTDEELHIALRFAINEYKRARSPAATYVAKRYSHMPPAWQQHKIERVQQCLAAFEDVNISVWEKS